MCISWFDSVYLNYKRGVSGSRLACKCGDVDGGGWDKDDMRFLIAQYLWENAYRVGEVLFPSKNIQCLLLPHSGSSLHKLLLFSLRWLQLPVCQRMNWQVGGVDGCFWMHGGGGDNSVITWFCSVWPISAVIYIFLSWKFQPNISNEVEEWDFLIFFDLIALEESCPSVLVCRQQTFPLG